MLSRLKIPKLIRWIFSTGIIFLILMTLLRLSLFFFFNRQGNQFQDVVPAFFLGIRYDLKMIAVLLLLILLAGCFRFSNPFASESGKKICVFIVSLASFLFVFFYIIDFANYSYLSQRLNASLLNYLNNAGISLDMIWQTYPVIRIILLLVAGGLFLRWMIVSSFRRIKRSASLTPKRNTVIGSIICFLLLALAVFGRVGQFPLRWSDAFALGNDYKANLALNPFQSFLSSLKFRHTGYDLARVEKAFPILAPYFGFPAADTSKLNYERDIPKRTGMPVPAPNVVLVICESFSAYKSSMWGNPLNTTPFFNGLTKKGIFFDHCFTPSYGTARGVWAVVTGIPDVEIATTTSSRNPAAVDQHSIINDFTGYDKFYFLGGSASWANIRGLLTDNIRGLHLYEQPDYSAPKIDVWGISDKNLFLEANKVLKRQSRPFFAVIQTADNHRPYSIPEEDIGAFRKITVSQDSLQAYGFESNDEMNAFRYTDFGYEKFIEAAEKEKYFANTIFLFVGDHGIPGNADRMFPKAWTDQRLSTVHVPLLLYAPGLLPPRRIPDYCSQLDVLPTLAGLAGIPYRNTGFGRDLLDSTYGDGKALSFIYDPDEGYIGLVKAGFYYREQLRTGKEEMVSVTDNLPVADNAHHEQQKEEMKSLAAGIYETSKYLVFHNKKKKQ